jgi:hypothetical protein
MAPTYEIAIDASERHRGLHLMDRDDGTLVASRMNDILYQVAAVVAGLVLLVTMV